MCSSYVEEIIIEENRVTTKNNRNNDRNNYSKSHNC